MGYIDSGAGGNMLNIPLWRLEEVHDNNIHRTESSGSFFPGSVLDLIDNKGHGGSESQRGLGVSSVITKF